MKKSVLWTVAALALSVACGDGDSVEAVVDGGDDTGGSSSGGNDQTDAAPAPDAGGDAAEPAVGDGRIGVVAGVAATGFVDGVGTLARFSGPAGAALSPDGKWLYIADTFNMTIRRADVTSGAVETVAGQVNVAATVDGIGTAATFQSPRGIAVSRDGKSVFIADAGTVRVLDTTTRTVTTVAGTAGETGYVDGTGAAVRFGYLQHAYLVSADGETLYIIDRSNSRLRAMDTQTYEVRTLAGVTGQGLPSHRDGEGLQAVFRTPGGMALHEGRIYIADMGNNCVRVFDTTTGEVSTLTGLPGSSGNEDGDPSVATFATLQGLSTDGQYLYAVGFNNVFRRIDMATGHVESLVGVFQDSAALDGDAEQARLGISFSSPVFLAERGERGAMLYLDRDGSSFRAIDLATRSVTTLFGAVDPTGHRDGAFAQAMFDSPDHLVCQTDGARCWVGDTYNHVIRTLDRATGQVSTLVGAPGEPGDADGDAQAARLAAPSGLALDEANQRLYVADTGNHAIRVVDLGARTLSTLAGAAEQPGSQDGNGQAARFDSPARLVLSRDAQKLYIADPGNHTIRVLETTNRSVSTLVGEASEDGVTLDGDAQTARLQSPHGLALASDGQTLFFTQASAEAAMVRAVSLGTNVAVTTLAGQLEATGVADGSFEQALFDRPLDLLTSSDARTLYVLDSGAGTVRRLDLQARTASTWLGSGTLNGNGATGVMVPWSQMTLYYPTGLARGGQDLLLLTENGVVEGHPAEAAW